MTFTYSAGTITQANEAPINITGISPLTGGFMVTTDVAHGYSNDDFVRIEGTTDYNSAFSINGVTSNTFNVLYQKFDFTSSQTGTVARGDNNLDGLTGLTGITKQTSGVFNEYFSGTTKITITGALRIDPRYNKLTSNAPAYGLYVFGGVLQLGKMLNALEYVFSHPQTAYTNTASANLWYEPGILFNGTVDGCLTVRGANSELIWIDSAVQAVVFTPGGASGNGFQFVDNAKIRIYNGLFSGRAFFGLCGIDTPNVVIENFRIVTTTLLIHKVPTSITGMSAVNSSLVAEDITNFEWRDLDIAGHGNFVDLKPWTNFNAPFSIQYVKNNKTGNNMLIRSDGNASRNKGVIYLQKEIIVSVKTAAGAVLEGASVYTVDTDNGQRKNLNGIDDTADKAYTATTGVDGKTGLLTINTAIINVASTTSTPPASTDPAIGPGNTDQYRFDFRGKSDTALEPSLFDQTTIDAYEDTEKFDFLVADYTSLITVQEAALTGNGVLTVNVTMLDDPGVVLSKAAAGALTGITVNPATKEITVSENHTLSEVYDFVKFYSTQNPDVLWDNDKSAIIATTDGVNYTLYTDWNLIVNTGITVSATGKKLSFSGTGTWTLTGTADFSGLMEDATNARVPIIVTNIVPGSRLYIVKDSDSSTLFNGVVSGTTETVFITESADTPVTIRLRHASGSPNYKSLLSGGTVTKAAGLAIQVSQELDE